MKMLTSMKRTFLDISLLAGFLLSVVFTLSDAKAEQGFVGFFMDKVVSRHGHWEFGYDLRDSGCVLSGSFEGGTRLWYGFSINRDTGNTTTYVGVTNGRWQLHLKPYERYTLELLIGRTRWTTTADPVNHPEHGFIVYIANKALVENIMSGNSIAIRYNGRQLVRLSLKGSRNAFKDIMECHRETYNTFMQTDFNAASSNAATADDPESGDGNGTGFFVSEIGHILTNDHVTRGCKNLQATTPSGRTATANVIQTDKSLDLSLLSTELENTTAAEFADAIELGEGAYAFGYPLQGLLSSEGNFTAGIVTGTSGIGNDVKYFQMSTPVQPGNSGGALFNDQGAVIGVVSMKLNAIEVAQATNDIPQNINFAVKSSLASAFIRMAGLESKSSSTREKLAPSYIARKAKIASVRIDCKR